MSPRLNDVGAEEAAEYLRLTLPLMSRYQVPATPQNYATWYAYVSGEYGDLKAEIDRLIGANTPFGAAVNADLYRRYVADQDIENIDRVRESLGNLLAEIGSSLSEAGQGADAYSGKLNHLFQKVDQEKDAQDIRGLLQTLIAETRSMKDTARTMQANFESKTQQIEDLQEELKRERQRAITDPLTGLFNRLALIDRLHAVLGEFVKGGEPPSVVMFDIDHFKQINDTHGHLVGDRVICFVAKVLENNVNGKACAARYGGEEFTVLLPQTSSSDARVVAENILRAISSAQLVRTDSKQPLGRITMSAGVAHYERGEHLMDFVGRADQALYQSKHDGRNRVTVAG